MNIYDITTPIHEGMTVYKNKPEKFVEYTTMSNLETGSSHETRVALPTHTGTHLDMPMHMILGGESSNGWGIDTLLCKRVVVFNRDGQAIPDMDEDPRYMRAEGMGGNAALIRLPDVELAEIAARQGKQTEYDEVGQTPLKPALKAKGGKVGAATVIGGKTKSGHKVNPNAPGAGRTMPTKRKDALAGRVSKAHLEKLDIREDDIVLLRTRSSDTSEFLMDFTYLDEEGAQYLVDCQVAGVGIDALGIERDQPGHPTHRILLGAGVAILEGLRLAHVPEGIYTMLALPLWMNDLDALPVRALLIQGDPSVITLQGVRDAMNIISPPPTTLYQRNTHE